MGHPLDWYPAPDDDQRGVPADLADRWVREYLAFEDSRAVPPVVAVVVPPPRPTEEAIRRAASLWDQRVYFMRCLDCRLIKIGYSKDVRRRRAQIERSTEHVLDIIGVKLGDRFTEAMIHGQFIRDRVKGEWYRESPELLAFMREHAHAIEETGPHLRGGRR